MVGCVSRFIIDRLVDVAGIVKSWIQQVELLRFRQVLRFVFIRVAGVKYGEERQDMVLMVWEMFWPELAPHVKRRFGS